MMVIDRIALILTIIGGLNWGSIGLFRFDIVAAIFGGQTATLSRVVYTLVGIAAIWCISLLFRDHRAEDSNSKKREAEPKRFCLSALDRISRPAMP